MISTVNAVIGDEVLDTGFHVTNPEPLALQKFLSHMVGADCEYAVLEVTSHGLDQERVAGINFEMGILTNITHEHLDYHKTFDAYKEAKAKLFKSVNTAILNKDDESFDFIKKTLRQTTQLLTYSLKSKADYTASPLHLNEAMRFAVNIGKEKYKITSNLVGRYNALNLLAAIAAARRLDISWESIQQTLASLPQLPGRLEKVENDKGINIYIDFAHTPDSLENVLMLLRKRHKGRVISIFGCAGERDVLKRPMMGKISVKLADASIFTAEDPRSEDVNKIIREILKGAKKTNAKEIELNQYDDSNHRSRKRVYIRIPERGEAISFAIQKLAEKDDVVVIFGKGHEKSMVYNGVEYDWSDKEAVEVALKGGVKEIIR